LLDQIIDEVDSNSNTHHDFPPRLERREIAPMRRSIRKRLFQGLEPLERRALMAIDLASPGPLSLATIDNSAVIRLNAASDIETASQAIYEAGGYVDGGFGPLTWGIVFSPWADRDAILKAWESSGWLASSDTDGQIVSTALPVSDPAAMQQWAIAETVKASVHAPEAWSRTVGAGVIVAVIDSGVDLNHPELAGQLWVNPRETAGNRRDDDRNGFVDDINGANFLTNSGNVQDDAGHGTHVSGIIAAAANNGQGGVGLAPGAKIMALKVLDGSGNGSISAAVNAIYYAVNNGAKVINASWTMSTGSPALISAMSFAASKNVVFVTAAGNDGSNNDVVPNYPGNYRFTNVLTVAAIDPDGKLASFSNYGASTVDVAAPGVSILSTIPGSYEVWDGTSMATPFVAATAALLAALRPDFTAAQIVDRIKATATRSIDLAGVIASAGYLDAGAATNLPAYVPPAKPVVQVTPVVRKPVRVVRRVPIPRRLR
jgi:subtilisin family serine protease